MEQQLREVQVDTVQMDEIAMKEYECLQLQLLRSLNWMRIDAIPQIPPGCSMCVIGRGKAMDARSASWSKPTTMPCDLPYSGPPDHLQPHRDYNFASPAQMDWPLSCQNSLTTPPLDYRHAGLTTGAHRRRASNRNLYGCERTNR